MAHPNAELIERFYAAFARHDGDAMAACYAPGASFSDPVFTDLEGEEPGAMWRMLTGRAEDLSVELRAHDADEDGGSANWVATYTFGQSGRPVVNDIQARFRFRDGLIAEHDDDFDFRHWARQALGLQGIAVALLPPLRAKARQRARGQLEDFRARESAGGECSVPAS